MHSEAFEVGYNVKYIRKILWTSPNNVTPPPKKIYIWGLRTPDPSPAPPPMVRDWRRNSVEFVTKRNKGIRNKSYFWKKTGQ